MVEKTQDLKKIKRIIRVLLANPDGIWLRKLSRESKLPLSTVHYYLEGTMANMVENIGARDEEGHFFGLRLVRLKNGIFSQLRNGNPNESLRKVLKTNEILSNLD
jgi:DNA-binding IclR family transcriptional regulator